MKGIFPRGVIFWLLVVTLVQAQEGRRPCATITYISPKGKVYLKKRYTKHWESIEVLARLSEGDTLKLGEHSRATLLYDKGKSIKLISQQKYGIRLKEQNDNSFFATLSQWIEGKFIGKPRAGIARGDSVEGPVLLLPQKGKLLTNRPELKWVSSHNDTAYQVRLEQIRDCEEKIPEKTIWKKKTQKTSLKFSADEPGLDVEKNYWVEISVRHSTKRDISGCFSVASQKERKEVHEHLELIKKYYTGDHSDDFTWVYVTANYLAGREFYTAALKLLQEMYSKYPDSILIQTQLRDIYKTL